MFQTLREKGGKIVWTKISVRRALWENIQQISVGNELADLLIIPNNCMLPIFP